MSQRRLFSFYTFFKSASFGLLALFATQTVHADWDCGACNAGNWGLIHNHEKQIQADQLELRLIPNQIKSCWESYQENLTIQLQAQETQNSVATEIKLLSEKMDTFKLMLEQQNQQLLFIEQLRYQNETEFFKLTHALDGISEANQNQLEQAIQILGEILVQTIAPSVKEQLQMELSLLLEAKHSYSTQNKIFPSSQEEKIANTQESKSCLEEMIDQTALLKEKLMQQIQFFDQRLTILQTLTLDQKQIAQKHETASKEKFNECLGLQTRQTTLPEEIRNLADENSAKINWINDCGCEKSGQCTWVVPQFTRSHDMR